ncbi:MAG: hypothetical protein IMZ52_04785 [Actinobacteria bacterium]|nr:hypothetical protein [Actinomycetota bacterium]MBE3114782.1 hypothetical protein [Actinomycetota bacterium]
MNMGIFDSCIFWDMIFKTRKEYYFKGKFGIEELIICPKCKNRKFIITFALSDCCYDRTHFECPKCNNEWGLDKSYDKYEWSSINLRIPMGEIPKYTWISHPKDLR